MEREYKSSYVPKETYIRVGTTKSTLKPFPTPSGFNRTLSDVDKDPYTDLKGYTHRNRVRHDVENFELTYNLLSDSDLKYILNAISPVWFYCEITDKKTGRKKVHKMYASDKKFNTFRANYVNGKWVEEFISLSVSFVEE